MVDRALVPTIENHVTKSQAVHIYKRCFSLRHLLSLFLPTRGLLAVETMHAIVQWLENFEYQKKYDVNVCKQEKTLYSSYF